MNPQRIYSPQTPLTKKLLALLLCALAPAVWASPKVALVIGNSQYVAVSDRLKNPINDAQAVHAQLRALGYDSEILLNRRIVLGRGVCRVRYCLSPTA